MKINRRALLKMATLGLSRTMAHAILPPLPKTDFYTDGTGTAVISEIGKRAQPAVKAFARALLWGVVIRSEPSLDAPKVGAMVRDSVLPIFNTVQAETGSIHNKLWYQVEGGYVYSAMVQPVPYQFNKPQPDLGEKGVWVELTIPFYDPRTAPAETAPAGKYRYYGSTVYKALKAVKGQRVVYTSKPNLNAGEDEWWYQIEDEAFGGSTNWFIPARYLRVMPADEFTTLSPNVDPSDKKLVINLTEQRVYAYERETEVLSQRTATGVRYSDERDFSTPPGEFYVFRKTPSQHMYGGAVGDDGSFDLPGVSWVSYFTTSGIAFHSTYWHNDFGVVRSHGCANLPADISKWIWRWTLPINDMSKRYTDLGAKTKEKGTRVSVVYS